MTETAELTEEETTEVPDVRGDADVVHAADDGAGTGADFVLSQLFNQRTGIERECFELLSEIMEDPDSWLPFTMVDGNQHRAVFNTWVRRARAAVQSRGRISSALRTRADELRGGAPNTTRLTPGVRHRLSSATSEAGAGPDDATDLARAQREAQSRNTSFSAGPGAEIPFVIMHRTQPWLLLVREREMEDGSHSWGWSDVANPRDEAAMVTPQQRTEGIVLPLGATWLTALEYEEMRIIIRHNESPQHGWSGNEWTTTREQIAIHSREQAAQIASDVAESGDEGPRHLQEGSFYAASPAEVGVTPRGPQLREVPMAQGWLNPDGSETRSDDEDDEDEDDGENSCSECGYVECECDEDEPQHSADDEDGNPRGGFADS